MTSAHYMLDTNIVSLLLRNPSPLLEQRVKYVTTQQICISAVTAGELYYGLARRPAAIKLAKQVEAFLYTVSVMDWTPKTAQIYGRLRAQVEAHGFSLATADMQIAAHAHALGLTLITNDQAFFKLQPLLDVEDWTV